MKPLIISIMSAKGGTGKTTIALNIASELVKNGVNVGLVDTDKQCSLSAFMEENKFCDCYVAQNIDKIEELNHQIVIIDTPPVVEKGITDRLLKVSDFILIPCTVSKFDIRSNKILVELCEKANKKFAVVLTKTTQFTKYQGIEEELKRVLKTRFKQSNEVLKANDNLITLAELGKKSKQLAQVQLILKEITEIIKG